MIADQDFLRMKETTVEKKNTAVDVEFCCRELLRERFNTLLLQKKMRQVDLAARLGVDWAYVCRVVNGKEYPHLELRLKIAAILGVDSALIWREK